MSGSEVEVVDATTTDVVLYDHKLFGELRWQDPLEANQRFAERFGSAQSLDDLFDVMSGNNTQKMVGRRLAILDVDFVAYQADDGVIPNALCVAADIDSGELVQFATTSSFCTMFLKKAELLGLYPKKEGEESKVRVKITTTLTRGGNTAINFERV